MTDVKDFMSHHRTTRLANAITSVPHCVLLRISNRICIYSDIHIQWHWYTSSVHKILPIPSDKYGDVTITTKWLTLICVPVFYGSWFCTCLCFLIFSLFVIYYVFIGSYVHSPFDHGLIPVKDLRRNVNQPCTSAFLEHLSLTKTNTCNPLPLWSFL